MTKYFITLEQLQTLSEVDYGNCDIVNRIITNVRLHKASEIDENKTELNKDPCDSCKYSQQACSYFSNGRTQENACMDKLIYIKWMVRHSPENEQKKHDDALINKTRHDLIEELQAWLLPRKIPLIKQRMWRKLESLKINTNQ